MKSKRHFLRIFLFGVLTIPILVSATAQEPDLLIWNGLTLYLNTTPLEPLLEDNPDFRPKSDVFSTGNYRGYIAHWELTQEHLYLVDVMTEKRLEDTENGYMQTEPRSVFGEMFPGGKPVYATWFSGHLVIPEGNLVNYVHLGFASTYDSYVIITVESGAVANSRKMGLQEFNRFRQDQFEKFRLTTEYQRLHEQLLKREAKSQEDLEGFLFEEMTDRYLTLIFP